MSEVQHFMGLVEQEQNGVSYPESAAPLAIIPFNDENAAIVSLLSIRLSAPSRIVILPVRTLNPGMFMHHSASTSP
ncbi:hypothetical protein [Parerythrobacter lacustris]|uniref:Uncharacterized protein n=1 Tax=Parerythrobacter lacustris TaxID=2969984 RepID=A0ABT1XRG6_9SPHN|nr:hypothetical protein [Parerythrobacter lacustris]MCR2833827.1 hypothetical protein [Parerythrobacter lacustris]